MAKDPSKKAGKGIEKALNAIIKTTKRRKRELAKAEKAREKNDFLAIAEREEVKAQAEVLAKRANQRLRQLEKSKLDGRSLSESSRAYQVTEQKVREGRKGYTTTKAGNIAFTRKFKEMSTGELKRQIREMERFLETSSTSTVRGYAKAMKKSYEEYQRKYGGFSSQQEYERFFRSESVKTFSYTAVKEVQRAIRKKKPDVTPEEIDTLLQDAIAKQKQLRETGKVKQIAVEKLIKIAKKNLKGKKK